MAGALLAVLLAGGPAVIAADKDEPGRQELTSAEHYLELFEKKVARAKGQTIRPGYEGNEALKRIKKLKIRYPDNAKVEALFQRARNILKGSKGETMTIKPEMLAYRRSEQELKKIFAGKADAKLKTLKAGIAGEKKMLASAFTAPSHREVDADDLVGKYVVLTEFDYPRNEYTAFKGQYVFVGSGAKGFYYVELSNRAWRGAYEALRRYRRLINRDLPEDGKWTLIGKVTGLELMIPQAGKRKTESAHWGWGVEPVAIYVPGCTLAIADAKHELGGSFAGESEMEKIKGAMYTVKSIPDNVTPEELTAIYITAIKEKNYPLFLECINPDRRKTPTALSRIGYHWDLHQERFAKLYCHVTIGKAKVSVLKGFDVSAGGVEDFFLDDKDKAKIKKHAGTLVEEAELFSKAWDENGKQYGSPKPRFFRRTNKKRWYIDNYPQPF